MAWEIAITIAYIGVAFGLFYIASNLDKDHYPLKLLFFGLGLYFLLSNFTATSAIINANNETIGASAGSLVSMTNSAYTNLMWIIWFVIAYFMIYFIVRVFRMFKLRREKEEE